MPYDIEVLDQIIAFASGQHDSDGRILALFSQFTSSEDGQELICKLEAIVNPIISSLAHHIGKEIQPNQVSTLLALFEDSSKAKVFYNEIPLILKAQISRKCDKGEPLTRDDIVDIIDMDLGDIEIPRQSGLVFYFAHGWRRGLYFDFGPILGEPQYIRPSAISAYLASMIAHVSYQERFSLTEVEWQRMFSYRWFPFSGLGNGILDSLINQIRHNENPDILQERITQRISNKSESWLSSWKSKGVFSTHIGTLEKAVDHFRKADYLSTSLMLMLRIEGILRSYQKIRSDNPKFRPQFLTEAAVSSRTHLPKSLLLPEKFYKYLEEIYFSGFNPLESEAEASRNSIAHGVASEKDLNEKTASLAMLIIHQLFYLCDEKTQDSSEEKAEDEKK